MDSLLPTEWIAQCADRLHDHWVTVHPAQLQEVAVDIWKNDVFRAMEPVEAAVLWLTPVSQQPNNLEQGQGS